MKAAATARRAQRTSQRAMPRRAAHSAHEAQAVRAAQAFVTGRTGLGAGLNPAPAAGFRLPGSAGQPLPQALRVQVENAFGAELGGVRIHHDAPAADAAAAHGANAFASGLHIYFGDGRYDPAGLPGRRLIAHEVAHVLQQTGRAAPAGRVRAAEVIGTGAVQCEKKDPNADTEVDFLANPKAALQALNKRHTDDSGADASLGVLVALVTSESGGALPHENDSTIGEHLIQIAADGEFDVVDAAGVATVVKLTTASRGYLIDALKVCGQEKHFEAAARAADADSGFEVRSAFGPRTAYRDFLHKKRGEDWVAAAFKHPSLAKFWPDVFFNVFEQYVFNPGRPRQSLYGFEDARKAALKNIDGKEASLLAGDRLVLAFELLDWYDRRRLGMMKTLDDVLEKHGVDMSKPLQRLKATGILADSLQDMARSATSATWRGAVERMHRTAVAASAYWERVQSLVTATQAGVQGLGWQSLEGVSATIKHVALGDARFDGLRRLLQGLAQPGGLYGLDGTGALTDLPAPATYEQRLNALGKALGVAPGSPAGNQLLVLQTDLIAQFHASASLDTELAAATGFAIWSLLELQPELMSYKAAKDPDAKRGFTDVRMKHRAGTAWKVAGLAQAAGWADVLAAAARILNGGDVTGSYLIVSGGWHIDESAPLSQMATDFSGEPVFPEYALTADNIARFFHASRLAQMTAAVIAQAQRVYADPKAKLEAEEINKVIRNAGRPWRVVPEGALSIIKPSEQAGGSSNPKWPSALSLINSSAKSKADILELSRLKKLGYAYYAALRTKTTPLFAWIFPDIALLMARLRGVEPFASVVPGTSLTDEEWMRAVVKKMDKGDLRAAIDKHLAGYEKSVEEDLELALREYTILLRRERRENVAGWLKKYAADRTVVNFEVPKKSVDALDWFRVEARPEADAGAQLSLLVLSLGDDLAAAFPAVRQAARIPPLFHYTLTEAVNFADNELAKAESGDAAYRKALEPLLYTNVHVTKPGVAKAPDEQFKDFLPHRDQLQALIGRIDDARKEIQESSGFLSPDGRALKTIGYYSKLEPGRKNAIEIDGDEWELVEVYQKFTYHPPLESSAISDQTAKPILKDGNDKVVPIDDRILATFLVNGIEYELRANETAKMKKLSEALFNFGFSRSMENLAEGLEAGAMFMMDVIELIPGVGQELMVARLTAQTAAFVGAELPAIAEALKKDPVDFIKDLAGKLMDKYLTLDGLITFVMLGGPSPLDLIRRPARDKQSTRHKPHGKLGRLLAMLRKLGMRIADAMQWLQLRVAGPVRSLQSSVATRPKLGWVLRKAMEIALWAREVVPPGALDDAGDKKKRLLAVIEQLLPGESTLPENASDADAEAFGRGLLARIESEVTQAGAEFKEQLDARLQLLAELQLPGEIVPLESVIAFIIDFFLSRLGAKVRIAKALLENTKPYRDLMGAIAGALADEARGTAVDPNVYWRKYVLDKVEDRFAEARNGLVDAIYGMTDRVADETGVAAFRLESPEPKAKEDMGIKRTPFPSEEIELAPAAGELHEVPARGRLAELPSAAGQPLAVRVRRVQEARFGHDFSHVRLNASPAAGAALKDMGADAATSGSHVFLRPGLDTASGEGARLLRHELTHVLQQTGARPLGQQHPVQPVTGRPGAGLTLDAMREAAADTMARADTKVARAPVEVMEGAQGVQPSLESAAVHMLQMFTEIHGPEEFEKTADPKDKASAATAMQLMLAVRQRLNEKRKSDFLPFAWPVAAHIATHVGQADLAMHAPKVAAMAQKPVKGVRGKKPRTELDFGRLVTLTEGAIFALTGVAMQLKATAGNPLKVDSLSVTYVHLGRIPPGTPGKTPLWDLVLANSPKVVEGDDPALVRLELFARLQALGPDPFVWKTGDAQYRFSDDFAEAYGKWRAKRKPDLVKGLPEKGGAPSIDPGKDSKAFKKKYLDAGGQGGIGLRIGLHGGHAGLEKQAGMDRESHHMVQYLLVQFFRNDNRNKAWRAGMAYTGLRRVSGAIDAYAGSAGVLQLGSLDPGGAGKRGSAMPAILVAADTHRRAQLHVERESQWQGPEGDPDSTDKQGRATQGFAIRAEFQRNQVQHLGVHDDAPGWKAALALPNSRDGLYKAMVGTYHWMYKRMMDQLEAGLQTRERAYYRAVAARIPGALNPVTGKLKAEYDLQSSDMTTVFARAKSHANDVMAAAGWPSP